MKVLLPSTVDIAPLLPEGVTTVTYDVDVDLPAQHRDAAVLVTWANPGQRLTAMAEQLSDLRLVQTFSAGPDAVLAAGFDPAVPIAGGVGLHTTTVTEHALALTLALVRRLPGAAAAQQRREWSREIGGPQPLHPPGPITTLLDARVLIWGFGDIGQRLAGQLDRMGARVRGVARTQGRRHGFEVLTDADLPEALGETDLLVMLLPETPETDQALNEQRLAQLRQDAYVVNVGRGSTVDEDALLAALRSGHLGGAAIDVTAIEPLPVDSQLWHAPRLIITPHAAGGRLVGAAELLAENLAALVAGEPLRNVVRAAAGG